MLFVPRILIVSCSKTDNLGGATITKRHLIPDLPHNSWPPGSNFLPWCRQACRDTQGGELTIPLNLITSILGSLKKHKKTTIYTFYQWLIVLQKNHLQYLVVSLICGGPILNRLRNVKKHHSQAVVSKHIWFRNYVQCTSTFNVYKCIRDTDTNHVL